MSTSAHSDEPAVDKNGFRFHPITSPYQAKTVKLRVLLPDRYDRAKKYRVLYVLPVMPPNNARHSHGLEEFKKLDVHNRHQLICVAPEFAGMPWYVDHPTDKRRRDETHLMRVVLPFVDKNYSTVAGAKGRLLVGFSKSGRGAMQLLLSYPKKFHKAAAWDSGVRIDWSGIPKPEREKRIKAAFYDEATFQKYSLVRLIKAHGTKLGDKPRLLLYNCKNWAHPASKELHEVMLRHKMSHKYIDHSKFLHFWHGGWLPEAVAFLVE